MAALAHSVRSEDPIANLLLKLRRRDQVSEHEADKLRGSIEKINHCLGGNVLVREGAPLSHAVLLIDGYVARYKDLADGQRQITELHVPGDFVDLHGFLLKHLEHHIGCLTPAKVALVPHERLIELSETEPHLSRLLWLSTLIDAAIQRERILTLGRRSAIARVAHLICELQMRLDVVGLADGKFDLPLTQIDLADATGLTAVHVNRMLRQLRTEGLMSFQRGVVTIHDLDGLRRIAEFDTTYLFLDAAPR